MTYNVYKVKRGVYKIAVFRPSTPEHEAGLEIYRIKGKEAMRQRVKDLEKLEFDRLPRPFHVHLEGKPHLQFASKEQQEAALKFCQRTNPTKKERYSLYEEKVS